MKRHYDYAKGLESTETSRHTFQQNDTKNIPHTIEDTNQNIKFYSLHPRDDGIEGEVKNCQLIKCRATLVNIAKVGERPIYVVQHNKANENEPLKIIPLENITDNKCCVDVKILNSILAGVNGKPKVVVLKRYKCQMKRDTPIKCGEKINRLEKDEKISVSKQTEATSINEERLNHNTPAAGYHKMFKGQTDATSIKEEHLNHTTQSSRSQLIEQDELNSISQIIKPEELIHGKEEHELDTLSPRESACIEYFRQQIKVEPTDYQCPQDRFFQRLNECLNSPQDFGQQENHPPETDNQMDFLEQRSQPINAHTTLDSVKHFPNTACCCKEETHRDLKACDLCSRPIIIQKIINQVPTEPKKVVIDRGTQTRKKKKWRCCC